MATQTATLISNTLCGTYNGLVFSKYSLDSVPSNSSKMFSIPLYCKPQDRSSYKNLNNDELVNNAYAIELFQYSIDCNSTDFDIRFLNVDNTSMINTYNELYHLANINLHTQVLQGNLSLLFLNSEDPIQPELYLRLTNNDGANATGIISLEFVYKVLKMKVNEFV